MVSTDRLPFGLSPKQDSSLDDPLSQPNGLREVADLFMCIRQSRHGVKRVGMGLSEKSQILLVSLRRSCQSPTIPTRHAPPLGQSWPQGEYGVLVPLSMSRIVGSSVKKLKAGLIPPCAISAARWHLVPAYGGTLRTDDRSAL